MTNEQHKGQRGFSLLEVMIVTTILVVIVGGIFQVLSAGLNAYNSGTVLVDVQGLARRTMEGMIREVQGAGLSTVSPTPPLPGQTGTSTITFQQATGYSGGSVTWGDTITVAFAYVDGESDNGADDNGNHLVDEGVVTLTIDDGEGGITNETIGYWVKEGGLQFNLSGALLTITLEVERYEPRGELMQALLSTTVKIKNQ